jgi:hypothetical protein
VLLLLTFGLLLALAPAGASTTTVAAKQLPKSRCCWVVVFDSSGSTVTDYGPKAPDPPISPAAVSGRASFSWKFSVRMVLGVKYGGNGKRFLAEPPAAVEAVATSYTESNTVLLAGLDPAKGHAVWDNKPVCTSPTSLPPGPFRSGEPYVNQGDFYATKTESLYITIPGAQRRCGWGENLGDHYCTGGARPGPDCYDFRGQAFAGSVELGSVKPFLKGENVTKTCSESWSHPFPSTSQIHHSFNGYVTTSIRFIYFPAPELVAKDKKVQAEIKNKTNPNVPASVKPPKGYSSDPPQSSPYACS